MAAGFSRLYPYKFYFFIVFFIWILDRFTKWLVKNNFELGESVSVLGNFFLLTYVENKGGAFGIQLGGSTFYFIASIVVILYILFYLWQHPEDGRPQRFSLALILGGAFGNLYDRALFGSVTDFFDFEFFNIPPFRLGPVHFAGMERWPVFNIADSAVTVGIVLLLSATLLSKKETPTPAAAADAKL
ncbi:MAG: signal peptidase II [candidate division Zixibacteria bacterium]|nr:signal peptidase II [candidate division Zixibacteria bacterium]